MDLKLCIELFVIVHLCTDSDSETQVLICFVSIYLYICISIYTFC